MKNFKKTFCIIMALAMLIPSIALFAGAADKDDFIIENPYKNVDYVRNLTLLKCWVDNCLTINETENYTCYRTLPRYI